MPDLGPERNVSCRAARLLFSLFLALALALVVASLSAAGSPVGERVAGTASRAAGGTSGLTGATINVPGDQPTLKAAVAAASSGDTIRLAPGTYEGGVWIENKSLTITSWFQSTGDTSYIDQTIVSGVIGTVCGGAVGCRGDGVIEFGSNADGSAVTGLTVTNGPKGIRSGSIVDISYSHVIGTFDGVNYTGGSGGTISNSLFANNGDDGIDLNDDVSTHVIDNTIRDNDDDGIEFRLRSGSPPVTLDFIGNLITGNKEDGIQFIDYSDVSARVLRVERNVFSKTAMAAIGCLADGNTIEDYSGAPMAERMYVINNTFSGDNYGLVGGANAIVLNNIFTGAHATALRRVGGNSIASYNLFWNNGTHYEESTVDLAHTLVADPLVNPDWTLAPGSPAIDAGTAFFQWQGETVLNLPPGSYAGSAPDLGAFEYGGGPGANKPPTVDAGPDQTITLPADAALNGTVNDDGLPNPPGALTTAWSVDSGPGSVTFADPNAVDTRAAFSTEGTYVLRLTATDSALSASDSVQITVRPSGAASVDRRIATGSDDAEEFAGGSMYLNSSDIELVFDNDNQKVGLRFINLAIPNRATITRAYIQFEADETQSEATNLLVQGQAADNANAFGSGSGNISARPRTAASTSWSPPAWALVGEAGPNQRTPDLSAVIQEIVNRPAWASGNALAIIISGTGHRTARAFEGKADGAALLHVDFTTGAVPDAPPTARLTVNPSSGPAPLAVTADASASTDSDATPIATYSFDFGDGSPLVGPQTGATANHTYTAPGPYTVTVTVRDTAGLSSTVTAQVTATDLPPTARMTVSPTSGATPLTVSADASASTDSDATPIASFTFDFGDGSPVVGPQAGGTASHTYTAAGTYTVTVTVRDTAGLSSTATGQVRATAVGDSPPAAALTVSPVSGTAPLAVSADASASTDPDATPIATYSFDFGDGSPLVGPQAGAGATHTYTAAGTYTVTVTVKDTAGLSSTASAQVVVKANLVRNPDFETNLTGWNTSGSGSNITLTRVTGGHTGSWAAKLANTGAAASTCTLNDSPNSVKTTSAGTYTGTLWVRADTAGATLKLRLREYNGSKLVGSATAQAALTTSWQQVAVTYAIASPGSSLDYNAYVSSAASGTCFYADGASVSLG
jgi:PKD repeat protein